MFRQPAKRKALVVLPESMLIGSPVASVAICSHKVVVGFLKTTQPSNTWAQQLSDQISSCNFKATSAIQSEEISCASLIFHGFLHKTSNTNCCPSCPIYSHDLSNCYLVKDHFPIVFQTLFKQFQCAHDLPRIFLCVPIICSPLFCSSMLPSGVIKRGSLENPMNKMFFSSKPRLMTTEGSSCFIY